MHFVVHHSTRYRYDVPVNLGRHTLRLSPQPERVRLHNQTLSVQPRPSEQRTLRDAYGNQVVEVQFYGSCQELRIDSRLELDTLPPPEPMGLPPLPWPHDPDELRAYYGSAPIDSSVRAFAQALSSEVAHGVLPFLDRLAHTLFSRFDRGIRPSGDAHSAAETLACGKGACRDLSVLYMDACRSLGIAARFVSGYQASAQTPDGNRHLHAWVEVRLPGIGFCGWDPTHGVRVGEGHVALCAAPEQAATMPVEGGFLFSGPSVRSTLDYTLNIRTS